MSELYLPDLAARRFEEIDFSAVFNPQRKFLCLDLDNTLLPQTGEVINPAVLQVLGELRDSNKVQDMCLISNVILPGRRLSRLRRLAERFEINHVVPGFFWNRKPKLAPFREALRLMEAKPEETVMVGDQIFSDILGGNRMGMYTIWLEPMSPDHWTTLLVGKRLREKLVRREMHKRGIWLQEP
ncbi:MAG: HAD-IIIA family hydrolase [Vulcanimicrobiota bacterium]